MANVCTNWIRFSGEAAAIAGVERELSELRAQEEAHRDGVVPAGVDGGQGHMFAIDWSQDSASYETKGVPNPEAIRTLADRHGASFVLGYHEPGDQLYGEITYQGGAWTSIELDPSDFEAYDVDEDEELWTLDGETYDEEGDVLAALLDRKRPPADPPTP